ncbi:MAG: cytochrome c peroxidase [Chthonomonadales bacterium]
MKFRNAFFFLPIPLFFIHGSAQTPKVELDRSPTDLAITADGRFAVTANATSNTVSLVDLTNGKLIAETAAGKRPFCISIAPTANRCAVSNQDGNSVTLYTMTPTVLVKRVEISVGDQPRGLTFSKDGKRLFVALSGEDRIAAIDVATRRVTAKLNVGIEPWQVALNPAGNRLAVGNARSQEVSVINIATWKVDHEVKLRGKNVRHVVCSPDGAWAYVLHDAERGRPTTKENIGMGWVIGSRLSRAPMNENGPREAIALDPSGKAVGDVDGLDVTRDGNTIAFTAGGTHELVLLKLPLPFVAFGGPGDIVEPEVLNKSGKYTRVDLGGRPLGVKFLPGGKSVAVVNYFGNSVQVVDVAKGAVTKTISLGCPAEPSIARKGEMLFHDAKRSHNQWYSCNSCHTEGHTNGSTFDTFNDGSYQTPKKTLSLRGVTETGPWTWHGWQTDLKMLIHDSMVKSMQGPEPEQHEIDEVLAYLKSLNFRANPKAGSKAPAVQRGRLVFNAKNCQTCHAPPNFTAPAVFKVGLESLQDAYVGFNPPSLRGVYNRSPYLHTGEATTLEQVLTEFHSPQKLTGKPDCTKQELSDLIAYLNTL